MTKDFGLAHVLSSLLGSAVPLPVLFSFLVVRSETADGMSSTLVLPMASRADASPFGVFRLAFLNGEVRAITHNTWGEPV